MVAVEVVAAVEVVEEDAEVVKPHQELYYDSLN